MSIGNYEQIKNILLDLWNKAKARDISSFLYSKDKATNTKTLKAKRADGSLGDIDIDISDLASQTLNNTFDGENIFKDIYIKDTVLTYVNNENATEIMNGEDQYSGVRELVIPANTYVSSIIIGLSNDLAIGDTVTGINVGTIGTDNVVLEHLIKRGTSRVEANSYSVLSSSKIAVVPINRSFDRDIYFMVGARGMVWNNGTGYNAIGGSGMPRPSATVSPNRGNYFGKIAIIGKGASLKERLGNMAKVNEFNSFTSTNNFKKILFEDGYLNTAILSKINNPNATTPSTGNNIYSASPAFRVQANTFVDKIIIGLGDDIDVGAEVIGVNIGVVGVENNTVMEHLITRGRATAIANTYNEISCSKIISVPINRTFDKEVYFMVGAKGMVWHQAQFAGVIASGGEDGMPSVGTRLSPNRTNYVGKTLMIGQGLSIQEGFEKAINTYNTVSQATSVGGNDHVGKLVKLSNNGKLDESLIPAIALNEVIPATDKNNALSMIGTGVGQINRGDIVTLNDGSIHIYKGRSSGETGDNFDRDFLSLSVGNGTVKRVNNVAPSSDGNVTIHAEHIKYHASSPTNMKDAIDGKVNTSDTSNVGGTGQGHKIAKLDGNGKLNDNMLPTTIAKRVNGQTVSNNEVTIHAEHIRYTPGDTMNMKQAIDGKPNTVNGQGQNGGNITIYADNINISRSNSTKISQALEEGVKKNQDNTFTKHNRFNDYSPTVHRLFTRKHINSDVVNPNSVAVYDANTYFAPVNEKYAERNKRITHVLLPIKGANVGDSISINYFIYNTNGTVTYQQEWARNYTVIDEEIAGCKCAKIDVDRDSGNDGIGFGFAVFTSNVGGRSVGAACLKSATGPNVSWTSTTGPRVGQNLSFVSKTKFMYKICYETTSELVTRFELENVTQMYPRNLIGEMKQLSYDAGNSLDDGTNTWLRANGQAINSNDYPELYEKFNTSRTDDDIEVTIPSIDSQTGYYYICAK